MARDDVFFVGGCWNGGGHIIGHGCVVSKSEGLAIEGNGNGNGNAAADAS